MIHHFIDVLITIEKVDCRVFLLSLCDVGRMEDAFVSSSVSFYCSKQHNHCKWKSSH